MKEELSIAASKLEVRSLKEPLSLSVSLFPSQTVDCPSEFVSLVGQDGRWEKENADAEINRGTSVSTTY